MTAWHRFPGYRRESAAVSVAPASSRAAATSPTTGSTNESTRRASDPHTHHADQHSTPGRRVGTGVLLLTAWAESALVEQSLLGWGACTLADNPVLDAALLNDSVPEVCAPGEKVQLRTDDSDKPISQLWQALPCNMKPSLSYVTSALHLDAG